MYIILVGAGRVGRNLAELLVKDKHEVTIIEKDKEVCQELSKGVDALVINGDATQTKILEDAEVKNAGFFIAVTGMDEVNLLTCLVAKNMGVKNVVARVGNPEYKDVFERLGIDHVVSPDIAAAEYIEKLVLRPSAVDIAVLGRKDVEVLEFLVTDDSLIKERKIGEIHPKNFLFIAVYEDDELIIPSGDTRLKKDSRVLVLVKSSAVKEVEKLFTKEE
jgi:trk system potassium uptake protein TrkA